MFVSPWIIYWYKIEKKMERHLAGCGGGFSKPKVFWPLLSTGELFFFWVILQMIAI